MTLTILGLAGLPDIKPGDDLAGLMAEGIASQKLAIDDGDVFVVTQKIVSKARGALIVLADVRPSPLAERWGARVGKDPRLIEVVLREAVRIVRMDRDVIIAETRHGFVCANAGVDGSNLPPGVVSRLPEDPDLEARALRDALIAKLGRRVAVIISDTFGRPWREGQVNVAIGVAGIRPLADYRGQRDEAGQVLQATVLAVADELASAAELVMGKTRRVPAAIVKASGAGWALSDETASARDLLRQADRDLFR